MTINYGGFSSLKQVYYLAGANCSIQNTTISMNGFNPNFVFYYEAGTTITVTFNNFTTNNQYYCLM
jgi:hypothetical protein